MASAEPPDDADDADRAFYRRLRQRLLLIAVAYVLSGSHVGFAIAFIVLAILVCVVP